MKIFYQILFIISCFPSNVNAQIYREVSTDAGIDHYCHDPNMMGGGVAIFDFNNDGWEDIYLTGGVNQDKLYENLGNGHFKDVSSSTGISLALFEVKTMGVVAGDVDNDGFTDLFVTTAENKRCYLLKNNNGISFEDVSTSSGITDEAWNSTATMGDYDLDGDIDIYVGNYVNFSDDPFHDNITSAERDFFYQNDGTGHFSKINNPLTNEETGCTLVASFSDIDQDGDQDLFVLNDFGDFYQGNKLLLNNYPQKTFQEIAKTSGMNVEINSMGIARGDYDEDGDLDYYITNIGENFLFEKQEGIKFKNVSQTKKVHDGTGFSWGAAFLDVNNDSYLDLFVAKGSILDAHDPQENKLFVYDKQSQSYLDESVLQQINNENRARGMAYGDFNNDGKLDIVIANVRINETNEGKALLYMNQDDSKNNWIKLILEGTSNNRSGYGSRVTTSSGDRNWMKEISGGSSYLSSHSNIVHFGLGDKQSIDKLTINWPGINKQGFENLQINKTYKIIEDKGIFLYTSRYAEICPGESIYLQGANRELAGIYIDTLRESGTMDEIVITKLALKENDENNCSNVVTGLFDETSDPNNLFHVYPNPFHRNFNIEFSKKKVGSYKLLIMDMSGRAVFTTENSTKCKKKLDVAVSLSPGVYFMKLTIKDHIYYKRIVSN